MDDADLVAAVLIEHDQEDGHDHDDADHDEGVEHRVEQALAHGGRVLGEWGVDAEREGQGYGIPFCRLWCPHPEGAWGIGGWCCPGKPPRSGSGAARSKGPLTHPCLHPVR